MTKEIASFTPAELHHLILALTAYGYRFVHPERTTIIAWDSDGEELELASAAEAMTFLAESRGGVQLWSSPVEDVFLSIHEGMLRLDFDGFTPADQRALLAFLQHSDLRFTVADEDTTYGS